MLPATLLLFLMKILGIRTRNGEMHDLLQVAAVDLRVVVDSCVECDLRLATGRRAVCDGYRALGHVIVVLERDLDVGLRVFRGSVRV